MTEGKKPYLLLSQAEKDQLGQQDGDHPGLLACGVYSAMQKNEELREEVMKLQHNLDESVKMLGILNAKIALLSTMIKPGNGKNQHSRTTYSD